MKKLIEQIDEDFKSSSVDGVCILSIDDWNKIKPYLTISYQDKYDKGYKTGYNERKNRKICKDCDGTGILAYGSMMERKCKCADGR